MSKVISFYRLSEIMLDDDGDILVEYDKDLPHHNKIAREICACFNSMHLERYFDGILKNKIASCTMTCNKNKDKESIAVIRIEGINGFVFSEKRRNEVYRQLDAQFADGWGECFFGYANIMSDSKGNKFFVE